MPDKRKQNTDRLDTLAEKWLRGTLTQDEEDEFNAWYHNFKDHEVNGFSENTLKQLGIKLYQKIQRRNKYQSVSRTHPNPSKKIWVAAASILLCLSAGIYLSIRQTESKRITETASVVASVKPGSNQASLSFDNGVRFDLNDLQEGAIYQTDGLRIQKLENGNLIYQPLDPGTNNEKPVVQNTLRTPAGGQYKVVLSDGTEVWLNAASQIRYPSMFNAKERIVHLQGEAYFHVAHDSDRPFIVQTAGQKIKVLGTQFNVNAYTDEKNTKTTLVSGKVEVDFQGQRYTLKPGEQTIAGSTGIALKKVNLNRYTAWKDGLFVFEKDNLQTVLRQFSRWYNIDVRYETQRLNDRFVGEISRQSRLEDALKILRIGGVDFRMEKDPQTKRSVLVVEK